MSSSVSLFDVAKAAGVSISTVSRVVCGKATSNRIPTSTQNRVSAKARELGYQPNLIARDIVLGKPFCGVKPQNGISDSQSQMTEGALKRRLIGVILTPTTSADTLNLIPGLIPVLATAGYGLAIHTVPADPVLAAGQLPQITGDGVVGLLCCSSIYSAVSAQMAGTCPVIVLWLGAGKAMVTTLSPPQAPAPVANPEPPVGSGPLPVKPATISPSPNQDGSAGTPRPTEIHVISQGRAKPPAEPVFEVAPVIPAPPTPALTPEPSPVVVTPEEPVPPPLAPPPASMPDTTPTPAFEPEPAIPVTPTPAVTPEPPPVSESISMEGAALSAPAVGVVLTGQNPPSNVPTLEPTPAVTPESPPVSESISMEGAALSAPAVGVVLTGQNPPSNVPTLEPTPAVTPEPPPVFEANSMEGAALAAGLPEAALPAVSDVEPSAPAVGVVLTEPFDQVQGRQNPPSNVPTLEPTPAVTPEPPSVVITPEEPVIPPQEPPSASIPDPVPVPVLESEQAIPAFDSTVSPTPAFESEPAIPVTPTPAVTPTLAVRPEPPPALVTPEEPVTLPPAPPPVLMPEPTPAPVLEPEPVIPATTTPAATPEPQPIPPPNNSTPDNSTTVFPSPEPAIPAFDPDVQLTPVIEAEQEPPQILPGK
ncbi:MAG: LacI family DNA-binding transcriptional regulator [bacterium]